jgi:hypothetical protein
MASASTLSRISERSLQRAVANRATIEQAKGILILRYRIGPEHAFDVLRIWAAETGHTLLVVARTLVDAASGDVGVATWDRALRTRIEITIGGTEPPDGPVPRLRSVT